MLHTHDAKLQCNPSSMLPTHCVDSTHSISSLLFGCWMMFNTPFTLALLIRSETGFAPLRAFTLHQLIRINNLIRIKLNHLLEVVSHRFSLLRDQITSVDANRTRTKEEQIEINARGYICIYGVACQELSRSRSSARLSTKYHCKLSVAIL